MGCSAAIGDDRADNVCNVKFIVINTVRNEMVLVFLTIDPKLHRKQRVVFIIKVYW